MVNSANGKLDRNQILNFIKGWIIEVVEDSIEHSSGRDFVVVLHYAPENRVQVSMASQVHNSIEEFISYMDRQLTIDDNNPKVIDGDHGGLFYGLEQIVKEFRNEQSDIKNAEDLRNALNDFKSKNPTQTCKKYLMTLTKTWVTLKTKSSQNSLLARARETFDRMDVWTVGKRNTFTTNPASIFMSKNGITHEVESWTDLKYQYLNHPICNQYENCYEDCSLELVIMINTADCVCEDDFIFRDSKIENIRKEYCTEGENKEDVIFCAIRLYVDQVLASVRSYGSKFVGENLRIGIYNYYFENGSPNTVSISTVVGMDECRYDPSSYTTSLDCIREKIRHPDTGVYRHKYHHSDLMFDSVPSPSFWQLIDSNSFKQLEDSMWSEELEEKFLAKNSAKRYRVLMMIGDGEQTETQGGYGSQRDQRSIPTKTAQWVLEKSVQEMPIKTIAVQRAGEDYYYGGNLANFVNSASDVVDITSEHLIAVHKDEFSEISFQETQANAKLAAYVINVFAPPCCPTMQKRQAPTTYSTQCTCTANVELQFEACLRGNRGPTGVPGIKGPVGATGVRGPPGQLGERGDYGDCGRPGRDGVRGEKGDQGEIGFPGCTGPRGKQGPIGKKGPKGDPPARCDWWKWEHLNDLVQEHCACGSNECTYWTDNHINPNTSSCLEKFSVGNQCVHDHHNWWKKTATDYGVGCNI